ncbi:MAG: hypothetical protein R3C10_20660 [Pirellulales bacterium]
MHRTLTAAVLYRPRCLVLLLGAIAVCVAGCGPDNPRGRLAVSGTVTLDGKPLDTGTIEFSPQDPTGVGTGAAIEAGAYTIDVQHGLPPGTYDVRVFSPDATATPAGPPGPLGPPAVEDRIPPRYNAETELSITVTADGDTVFDFPLKSS